MTADYGKEIEVKKAPEFVKRTLEPCGIFKLAALLGQSLSLRIAETAPFTQGSLIKFCALQQFHLLIRFCTL